MVGRAQSLFQLGRCYTELKHWDQAATVFEEAATLLPQALAPQLAAARSWEAAGRLDESVRNYRRAVQRPDATEDVWASLVGAQIRQQVTTNERERDWKSVEENLAKAQQLFPAAEALKGLSTQLNDLRHGTRDTLKLMEDAQAADPQSARLTEGLMVAYEAEGQSQKAEDTLNKFVSSDHDGTDSVLLRRLCWWLASNSTRRGNSSLQRSTVHQPSVNRKSSSAWPVCPCGRANWTRPEAFWPNSLRDDRSEVLLELLADLALETRNLADLAHWEDELKKQEGSEGTGWRFYRAQRLLNETSDFSEERLVEAERLTSEIQRLRPMWSIGLVLQGQVAERRGQSERAIEAYRKAIELGEKRRFVREQLVGLLFATGQNDDAEKFLTELGDAVSRSPRLANIAIYLRLRHGDTEDAVQMARQEVERRPEDALGYVALGQSLLAAGNMSEAEDAFRRATKVAPADLRGWQALFGCLVSAGKPDEARQTLEAMTASAKIPEQDLLSIVAQDQVLMGDAEAAEKSCRKLLKLAPEDPATLRRVAGLLVDRDPDLAEQCLRQAHALARDSRGPRLDLAAFLITRGSDAQLAEAAQLLDASAPGSQADAGVQRLQARLLLRRGEGDDRERGKRILDDLMARGEASDEDRSALADMYEAEGQPRKAQEYAYALVNRKNPQPAYVSRYVDLLLKDNRATEAEPWFAKLSAADPESFATLSLQARLLASEKRTSEIEPLVEAFLEKQLGQVKSDEELSQLYVAVGRLYAQLQMDVQAERTLRQAVAQSPTGNPALVNWLANHGALPRQLMCA